MADYNLTNTWANIDAWTTNAQTQLTPTLGNVVYHANGNGVSAAEAAESIKNYHGGVWGNSLIVTDPSIPSYTGIISDESKFTGEGTRVYLMPPSTVTTGLTSGFKIFADTYQNDSINYRDTGLYHSLDQAGDLGYHGNGVFYINSKVNGTFTENHDIAVTFQDGPAQAIKWTFIDGANPRGISVIGKVNSTTASAATDVNLEMAGNIGFDNAASGIKWWGVSGGFSASMQIDVTNGRDEVVFTVGGNEAARLSKDGLNQGLLLETRVVGRQFSNTSQSTPNAAGWNSMELSYGSATTLTDITDGKDGQVVTLIATNGNATVANNANISLVSGANYAMPSGSAIQLCYSGTLSKWIEIGSSS